VEAARRDGGFTLYYLGINIGALLGLAACSVVSERLGWHWGFGAAGVFMLLSLVTLLSVPAGLPKPPRPDSASSTEGRARPGIIALLGVFMLVFWTCYELSSGPLNNPSEINWTLLGAKVHPGMFGNAGAWLMLLLAPLLVVLWDGLAARGSDPIPPVKMGWGFLLTALGFAFMFGAWKQHQLSSQASVAWLLMTHLFLCLGELCLAPIALSMVTRLAPARFPSLTVATWFLVNLVATKLLFGLTRSPGDFARFDMLFFTGIAVVAAGALLLALAPMLGRWLHGASTASPPFPEAPAHRAP
jgi:POT family proton-dependent oligopeptide transporter